MARSQQTLSEKTELEQQRAELSTLRARHAQAQSVLQQLHDDIASFEYFYDHALGKRVAELDKIEAEIALFSANPGGNDEEAFEKAFSAAQSEEAVWQTDAHDIKSLYREVAKTIHPDLAPVASATQKRHELMAKANRAYAEEDSGALQEILSNWRRHRAEWDDDWAELLRVRREIARERQELAALNGQVVELRRSCAFRMKLHLSSGPLGSALLADMVTAVDLNIDRALKRLAALRGEKLQEPQPQGQKQSTRRLRFPDGFSCGILYQRDRSSLNYSQWKTVGAATGCMEIAVGMAARLDLRANSGIKLSQLQRLNPDDLQALFLYEFSDADLENIVHLAGLEELYLSGARVTDAALMSILPLTNLRRIYLYQTAISDKGLAHLQHLPNLAGLTSSGNSITDEGLAVFQRAIPRVKTVSFQWRR